MKTIYIVVSDSYSISNVVQAFTVKEVAEEFVAKCEEEVIRITDEVNTYREKHRDELHKIGESFTKLVLENSKKKIMIDYTKVPESIRRLEIQEGEEVIYKSHKYDSDFCRGNDPTEYYIQEAKLA
jgi:hypothetical protein